MTFAERPQLGRSGKRTRGVTHQEKHTQLMLMSPLRQRRFIRMGMSASPTVT
jgi:hypothetical protein